jgi:replicative DNA helicase
MAKHGSNGDFTLDKALPSSIEAERLILGVVLLDNVAINQAAENLKPDDFFIGSNRRIYEKMLALYERGQAIDPLTLQEELRRAGELEQVGGPAYIAALFDGVPRFSNIENYVDLVKGKSMLRRLITSSNQIMAMAFDDEEEPENILDKAESMILAIGEDRIKQGFIHIGDVAARQLTVIEESAGREQLITGLATGFADLDYMTSGLQRGDLIIIAARPSMGKCLTADSEIVLADGSVATIEEIYRRREAELLTLGDDFKFRMTRPSAFVDDGIKPVYRLTTRLGRYVDSTLSHPYLTIDGWRKLSELKVGDHVAVPRKIDVFGSEQLHEEQVKLLAYLIGDGNLTDIAPSRADTNPRLRQDRLWLEEIGLRGRGSREKFIPSIVFSLTKPLLAMFLNRLFATGGWVVLNEGKAPQLGYSTVSEKVARQIQSLLLRFGVIAKLRKHEIKYADTRRVFWRLAITHGDSIRAFADLIGGWGREDRLVEAVRRLSAEETRNNRDLITGRIWKDGGHAKGVGSLATLARRAGLKAHADIAHSDVYWDEIVSIEYLGDKQVYDLTMPETHNFVANDICVHNTAFSLNIAQNAATRPQYNGEKAVVGVFSLEMSNEQLVNRLLCSQARVDAHRLRSGYLSKDEWRRLAVSVGELAETKIYLDDTPGVSVLEMRAKARRLKNEQKALDLLIVDYLQLMSGRGRNESRQQEVSQISRELKMLAKELNVPLIALSQLSRAPETRTGSHKPQLSDLRESGSIEQDADVVMFIYREEVYKPETEKQNIAEIIIGKQRNGPIGSVELVFLKQLTRFEDKFNEQA